MTSTRPNALVMQSGGCTHVLNRSLYGIASEFKRAGRGNLYGAPNGLEGILQNRSVDLSQVSDERWLSVAGAPGAAIGSTRRRLREDDVQPVFEYLDRLDIGCLVHHRRQRLGRHRPHPAPAEHGTSATTSASINVPKTIDNDLVLTDHSPGFGSAARFVSMAVMGSGLDAEAMKGASPITIFEVMGRDAGWLAASAALAKREDRDAPHLICVPEVPIDENAFVARMEDSFSTHGFAVAVVSENTRGVNGVLGAGAKPLFIDDFGHEYHDGPARYLAALVSRHLRVRARYEKPGTIQRSFVGALSEIDAQEAELVGRAAVRVALDGLQRRDDHPGAPERPRIPVLHRHSSPRRRRGQGAPDAARLPLPRRLVRLPGLPRLRKPPRRPSPTLR